MNFEEKRDIVLDELNQVFHTIDPKEVQQMVDMICKADKVFVVGVGRVLLMMQAFEKRLNHLGIDSYYVGEINEPAITENDVLIVGSGSGESLFPLAIIEKAKQFGAKTIHIGSTKQSSMTPFEDCFVRIPCQTKLYLEDEISSNQIMSSLFEQSLLLLADMTAMMIVEEKGITNIKDLWHKHANLE